MSVSSQRVSRRIKKPDGLKIEKDPETCRVCGIRNQTVNVRCGALVCEACKVKKQILNKIHIQLVLNTNNIFVIRNFSYESLNKN